MADSFKARLQSGSFQVVARIVPPKGSDLSQVAGLASSWRGKVDTVLVADNASANMGVSSLVMADRLKRDGWDLIMTLSCRDRNRMALGSEALGAAALSVESLLCVSGDHFNFGDHPQSKPVYDMDSVQLIEMLKQMGNGTDVSGNPLDSPVSFFPGAAVCAAADPLLPHLMKLRKKIAAGAGFVITLPLLALEQASAFLEGTKDMSIKVLAGVLLPSFRQIQDYRDGSIAGTLVPESLVDQWKSMDEQAFLSASAAHVKELIGALRGSGRFAGVCVSASGRESEIGGLL